MKFTSLIAVIGAANAINFAEGDTTPTWGLRSVTDHREEAQTQIDFGNTATDRANARPPLRSHAQLNGDEEGSEESGSSSEDEDEEVMLRGDDDRKPARFMNSDSDDLFMRSILNNYAVEGKDKDDAPNGVFTVNEAGKSSC